MSEEKTEQPAEVKAEEEVTKNNEEQHDEDESDSEKKEEPKLNEKGEYDGLRIKLKGLPLNRYVRDTNSLHKIIMDLFVTHLKCGVPKVKAPKVTDRWLVLEMASNEDKKKILTTIVNNYKWMTYRLTVRNCEKGAFTFRQPEVDEKGEAVELTEESVVDVLLKYHKMPYFQQLQTKSQDAKTCITEVIERLKTTEPYAANQVLKKQDLFEDIVPSPVIDGYSNDNFFSFVKDKVNNTVNVGIMVHSGGKSVLAPIEKCRQVPRQMMDVVLDFTNKIDSLGLSVFDPDTKEGAIGGIGIQMNGSGEMLMSVYTAQSQESSFVPADVMRKKPNKGGQKGGEAAKKEDAKKAASKEEAPKEEAAKEGETKADEATKEGEVKAEEAAKEGEVKAEGATKEGETKAEEVTVKKEEEESDEVKKEDVTSEEKKELDDSKFEGETLDGGKLTFKKLKEAMASFYEEVGKAMGVKSIYKGTILYGDNGELVEKLISFTFLAGVRSLKEVVNGVEFVLTPSRLLWPNARSFGILASVTERLAKICPSTVVVLACNDQRWLPTYFAKKCKEVLAISTWTTQTCQELLRTSHQKGIHNINYFNCNARIPPPVLKRPDRMVLIVWDHGDGRLFRWLNTILGFDVVVDVATSARRGFIKSFAKHVSMSCGQELLPSRVVPVDAFPHTGRYAFAVLFEKNLKNRGGSMGMKPSLKRKPGWGRNEMRAPPPPPPPHMQMQGPPRRMIEPPPPAGPNHSVINQLINEAEANRAMCEYLVSRLAPGQQQGGPPPQPLMTGGGPGPYHNGGGDDRGYAPNRYHSGDQRPWDSPPHSSRKRPMRSDYDSGPSPKRRFNDSRPPSHSKSPYSRDGFPNGSSYSGSGKPYNARGHSQGSIKPLMDERWGDGSSRGGGGPSWGNSRKNNYSRSFNNRY